MSASNQTPSSRPRVAVVFGGRSSEHPVSCATAASVMAAIDSTKWEVVPIGITREGQWVVSTATPEELAISAGHIPEVAGGDEHVIVPLGSAQTDLQVVRQGLPPELLGEVDVVFPLLHGPFGEDGTLQGLLEMADLRYVGCGVASSAMMMDKHHMKVVFEAAGLEVGPYRVITDRMWRSDRQQALASVEGLDLPVFVKPARAGSSCGITRVEDWAHLEAAVAEAQEFDPKVVVEAGIEGREIECAVLDGHHHDAPRASHPGEVVVVGKEDAWYDFETKYVQTEDSVLRCPADLPQPVRDDIRAQAVRAFLAVDAEGLARADFFWTADERVVINEINTLPGFTPISMYRLMWEETGIGYAQLVDELLRLALERPVGLR